MNIRNDAAGCVDHEHILNRGFKVFDTIVGNDMGMSWSIPQYKNSKCTIIGGYWHWKIKDNSGKELFGGWWNSNEEFDRTVEDLNLVNDYNNWIYFVENHHEDDKYVYHHYIKNNETGETIRLENIPSYEPPLNDRNIEEILNFVEELTR